MKKWPFIILAGFIVFLLVVPTQNVLIVNLADKLSAPSAAHIFGTDNLGRDVFSLTVRGGIRTLVVVATASAISFSGGLVLGLAGGYFGGQMELGIRIAADFTMAVPSFIFALIFTGIFGMTPYTVGIILGLCGIGQYALQAEALTRSVRKMAYIENEKILGMPARHTLFGHILPNILYPMFTSMGNRAGGLTLSSASLAFIGLGVDVTSPDWGNMIYQYKIYVISNPNLILAPTLAVFLLALLFHLAFDGGASNKPEEVTIYD